MKSIDTDSAPAIWAICTAFVVALALSAMVSYQISPPERYNVIFIMAPIWMIKQTAPLVAALLTRRSPVPVFIAATGLAFAIQYLLPRSIYDLFGPGALDAFITMGLMFALTRIDAVKTVELRRLPGSRMKCRAWVVQAAALLFALPPILSMTSRNAGRGGIVMLSAVALTMLFIPIAFQILIGWIAAFVANVSYATIVNRR